MNRVRDAADQDALRVLEDAGAPVVYGHAIRVRVDARAVARCIDTEAPTPATCMTALEALRASRAAVRKDIGDDAGGAARFVFWLEALARTALRLEAEVSAALEALDPPGRRRPSFGPAHRESVNECARHVEDVADNVRFVL